MTTIAPATTIASYARDFSKNEDGAEWLTALRNKAWAEFESLGFPTKRRGNELWKYTDLRVLDTKAFSRAEAASALSSDDLRKIAPWNDDWHTAVTVDGQFSSELSRNLSGDDIAISNLIETAERDKAAVEPALGSVADIAGNAFVALNTALFKSGVLVKVDRDAEPAQPIHILHIVTAAGADNRAFYPRILLLAGENSKTSIIESYVNVSEGSQFTVPVFEASLSDGAAVRHFRVQLENEQAIHLATTRTEQPDSAVFNSTTFATGPAIGRNDVHTNLSGEHSETNLHGLYITDGSSHQDNEISTTHQKPHGTSHQFYKGILAGKSRAVFSGKVLVQAGAMKTLALQKDLNLLLSHGAEIDTKPSLEIYADDVKCAHGATAGHVDPTMLFYLMSRGVRREDAAIMLVSGFASEIIEEFEPESLREFLYSRLERIIPELDSEGIL